jgi:hypothetical protein
MKKTMLTIGLAAFLLAGITQAQTNVTALDPILQQMMGGAITNVTVDPYATYAPSAPTKWGGGILIVYNINPNGLVQVGPALGADWLGDLSLVSGNMTLSAPFHPFPSKLPSFVIIPIGLVGIHTAYSGNGKFNGDAGTVVDAGAMFHFGHFLGAPMNAGACYGKWSGVGPYDKPRFHIFTGFSF